MQNNELPFGLAKKFVTGREKVLCFIPTQYENRDDNYDFHSKLAIIFRENRDEEIAVNFFKKGGILVRLTEASAQKIVSLQNESTSPKIRPATAKDIAASQLVRAVGGAAAWIIEPAICAAMGTPHRRFSFLALYVKRKMRKLEEKNDL